MKIEKLDANGATVIKLLADDDKFVGSAKVRDDYLSEVWVAPQHRGRNVGTLLTRCAIAIGATWAIVASDGMESILSKLGWFQENGALWRAAAT